MSHFAFCQFGDDIRFEMGDKLSLNGMYRGTMIMNHQPAGPKLVLKLVAFFIYVCDVNEIPSKFRMTIKRHPEDQVLMSNELPFMQIAVMQRKSANEPRFYVGFPVTLTALQFEHSIGLEAIIETNQGAETVGWLDLHVPDNTQLPSMPIGHA